MNGKKYDLKKQHEKGKLHAIERIEAILDEGSFVEIGYHMTTSNRDFGLGERKIPYDGVITGFGTVNERQVYI